MGMPISCKQGKMDMEAWRFLGVCASSPSLTFEARAGTIVSYIPFCLLLYGHPYPLEKSIDLLGTNIHGFWWLSARSGVPNHARMDCV
jgi:hypothetical protein